jgi:ATP-dependent Zn protease
VVLSLFLSLTKIQSTRISNSQRVLNSKSRNRRKRRTPPQIQLSQQMKAKSLIKAPQGEVSLCTRSIYCVSLHYSDIIFFSTFHFLLIHFVIDIYVFIICILRQKVQPKKRQKSNKRRKRTKSVQIQITNELYH